MKLVKRVLLSLFCALCLGSVAQATLTLVNHTTLACSTGTSCAVTIPSTGSGNLLIATLGNASNGLTITGVTGAGTWGLCPASECASLKTDAAYNLNSTGGVTSVTINFSGSASSPFVDVIEYSFTAGSVAYDKGGALSSVPGATSTPGVALTLTGTNDVIVQAAWGSSANATAITSPYTDPTDFISGIGFAGAINTASGTAPTWTFSSSAGTNYFSGIAIKEVAAVVPSSKRGGPSKWKGPAKWN